MARKRKLDVITFKVDTSLRRAMREISNCSEFIRAAVLSALESVCPLCKGTGILTPDQRRHWNSFAKSHSLAECSDCHAVHLVCDAKSSGRKQNSRRSRT
jgi:hypothetical protein